jgi:hypothetical protein
MRDLRFSISDFRLNGAGYKAVGGAAAQIENQESKTENHKWKAQRP